MLAGLAMQARRLAPGLIVAFTVAAAAMFLHEHYRVPTMLFALFIGMAFYFRAEDEKRRIRSTPVWLFSKRSGCCWPQYSSRSPVS